LESALTADLQSGIGLPRILKCDLEIGIFHLLGSLDYGLHRERIDLSRVFVELGAEILLRLVVFAGGHDNGVFHRADYNLRINAFFPAQCVDRVVELACHKNQSFNVSKFQRFKVPKPSRYNDPILKP